MDAEMLAIRVLETAFRRLVVHGDYLDTTSDKGYQACQNFLQSVDKASDALGLRQASRAYRSTFSGVYRNLFDGEQRSYRVDILEAGTSGGSVIWANGEEFKLDAETLRASQALWNAWMDLGNVLHRWIDRHQGSKGGDASTTTARDRTDLCVALDRLDAVWATFEQAYVSDLMQVQARAWALVAAASRCEATLTALEQEGHVDLPAYSSARRDLVSCIARLNSVANTMRKGRDDFSVDILDRATEVLRRCEPASISPEISGPAAVVASRVVDSFEALRSYLGQVPHYRDEMVPNLCQNEGLVARLVDWEKSWEIGARHVLDAQQLNAFCHLAAGLRSACRVAPSFMDMVSDCDPELFLSLPRVAWLHALEEPSGPIAQLLRGLLPHCFAEGQDGASSSAHMLMSAFRDAAKYVEGMWAAGPAAKQATWELFIRRAVGGPSAVGAQDLYACLPIQWRGETIAIVERFMNELERWSMELQRHHPEDWNEYVDLLVQCLKGDRKDEGLSVREFVV